MYILTKKQVIYGICERADYFRLQNNGYYVPSSFASSTHLKVDETFHDVKEYRLFEVSEVPENLSMEGSWVFSAEGIFEDEALKSEVLRKKRDVLLSETDWAICLDSPLDAETKSEVVHYRQALRDFPQQEGFPFESVFPESPLLLEASF